MPEEQPSEKSFFREMVEFVFLTLLIVLPIRFFIAEPFVVSGASMEPTFETGDYLIIDRLSYDFREPKRGEVVIFKYPKDPSKYFIKRLLGLPGEKIELRGQEVIVKNSENPEGFSLGQNYVLFPANAFQETTLEENEYFVLGDNRAASSDSRIWGALPKEDLVGRPILRLLPPGKIGIFPGLVEAKEANDSLKP